MLTPFSALVFFMGIPVGFLLARIKKYRGLYILGHAVVMLALLAMWRFIASTPIWVYVLVTSIAGIGLGMIPTINAVVAQFAVPKELLGVAVGAIFFFQMVDIAVSPAILGFAQSSATDRLEKHAGTSNWHPPSPCVSDWSRPLPCARPASARFAVHRTLIDSQLAIELSVESGRMIAVFHLPEALFRMS